MSLFCRLHQGQFDIDGNPSFIDLFLEDQTNLHFPNWVHKVIFKP